MVVIGGQGRVVLITCKIDGEGRVRRTKDLIRYVGTEDPIALKIIHNTKNSRNKPTCSIHITLKFNVI